MGMRFFYFDSVKKIFSKNYGGLFSSPPPGISTDGVDERKKLHYQFYEKMSLFIQKIAYRENKFTT